MQHWDHDKTRYNIHTSGFFTSHVNKKLGFGFEDLDHLSVRQQREVVIQRVKQMMQQARLKNKSMQKGKNRQRSIISPPIDDKKVQLETEVEKRRTRAKSNGNLQSIKIPPMQPLDHRISLMANTPLVTVPKDSLNNTSLKPIEKNDSLVGNSPYI